MGAEATLWVASITPIKTGTSSRVCFRDLKVIGNSFRVGSRILQNAIFAGAFYAGSLELATFIANMVKGNRQFADVPTATAIHD